MNAEEASEKPFGGQVEGIEADECEVGRKRRVPHGHDTDVKGDFSGLFERNTPRVFVESYEKMKKTRPKDGLVPHPKKMSSHC